MSYVEKLPKLSAQETIENFLSENNVADVEKSLNDLFLSWVCSEIDYTQADRAIMAQNYKAMLSLLTNVQNQLSGREVLCTN